jgi:predicted phosphodiesterase
MKILCFGDSHVAPKVDLEHFSWLSNYILEHKPEYVVQLGDFLTLDCLNTFDKDKRGKMEGKRYSDEIVTGKKALRLLFCPIRQYNDKMFTQKKKMYAPTWYWLEGNHEDRLTRYLDNHPHLKGQMNLLKDLGLHENCIYSGMKFFKFKHKPVIHGISFTHALYGDDGKAASRKNPEVMALDQFANHVVWGHQHQGILKGRQRENSPLIKAICVGMFARHTEEWIKGASPDYWRGFVMLHCENGVVDPEFVSMERLEHGYSN